MSINSVEDGILKQKREVEYSMKKRNMEGGIIHEIIEKSRERTKDNVVLTMQGR